jgi:hypothetical protein
MHGEAQSNLLEFPFELVRGISRLIIGCRSLGFNRE